MNFFYLLKKHFLSSNFLNFLFLGLSLIFLFVLLFFVPELIVNLPVKRLLFLLVAIFYFLDAYYLLNLIETNSRTDLEKIQVNSIIRSISDPVISYDTNFEIIASGVEPAVVQFNQVTSNNINVFANFFQYITVSLT